MKRSFWTYQNEPNGERFICDFNQRGFNPDRVVDPLHVVEMAAVEKLIEALRSVISNECHHCYSVRDARKALDEWEGK